MEHFDDLMGITHSTGDAFLDKKLNQNTCNILGTIVGGAVLGALNKPKAPKVAGGGVDPFLQPFMKPELEYLQEQLGSEAERVLAAEQRVARRTRPELQAETSLLALAGADPEYISTYGEQLGERLARAEGIGGVTTEDIVAQREALRPIFESQELEARRALQEQMRDVGLAATGGVGELTGERADILRGTALGEFARTQAQIGSDLSRLALERADTAAAQEAAGFERAMGIERDIARTGRTGFEEALERAELARTVGERERAFKQDLIGAQQSFLADIDPVRARERYLATVAGTPMRGTKIYQPQSTMQSVLGGITAMSGFANQGGSISSLATGGIFSKEEEDDIKDIEDFSDKEFGTQYGEERKAAQRERMRRGLKGLAESGIAKPKDSFLGKMQGEEEGMAKQRAALERTRRRLGMFQEGGSVGNYEEGGVLSKIMKGVSDAFKAVKNIEFDEETQSLGKYDPFAGMSRQERLQIGLAAAGNVPELGQGPFSAYAEGAAGALKDIQAQRKKRTTASGTLPSLNEYLTLAESLLKSQGIGTGQYGPQLAQFAEDANRQALLERDKGLISGTAEMKTRAQEIFSAKVLTLGAPSPAGIGGGAGAGGLGSLPSGQSNVATKTLGTLSKQKTNP